MDIISLSERLQRMIVAGCSVEFETDVPGNYRCVKVTVTAPRQRNYTGVYHQHNPLGQPEHARQWSKTVDFKSMLDCRIDILNDVLAEAVNVLEIDIPA